MVEHGNEPSPSLDLREVAEESVDESVAAEQDVVESEMDGDSGDVGGAVPEDDAQ